MVDRKEVIKVEIDKGPDPLVMEEEKWREVLRTTEESIRVGKLNNIINKGVVKIAQRQLKIVQDKQRKFTQTEEEPPTQEEFEKANKAPTEQKPHIENKPITI